MSSRPSNQNAPTFQPLSPPSHPARHPCPASSWYATFFHFLSSLDYNLQNLDPPSLPHTRSRSTMASKPPSGASTPNPRFTPQAKTAEDLLSTQTVGLVALSDFRKRRAEALEAKERDAQELLSGGGGSGRGTPGTVTPTDG